LPEGDEIATLDSLARNGKGEIPLSLALPKGDGNETRRQMLRPSIIASSMDKDGDEIAALHSQGYGEWGTRLTLGGCQTVSFLSH